MLSSTEQSDAIVIAAQHPAECVEECVSLLNATRKSEKARQRFEWLYLQNPDGPAVVWLAHAGEGQQPIGFAAVLPRRMQLQGRVVRCWNCCDLSVLPEYRRRGVATALRQQARLGVDRGEVEFLYGHPNDRAAGAHIAAGHFGLGTMCRVARPISLRPYLAKYLRSQTAATCLDSLFGRFWRPRRRLTRASRAGNPVEVRGITFDQRFDELFRRVAAPFGVIGIRDSQYLNWRYSTNPLDRTDAIVVSDADHLQGYLLFSISESMLQVKDLLAESEQAATLLIEEALQVAVRESVDSLSFTALESHPALSWLRRLGFRRRPEVSEAFVYTALEGQPRQDLLRSDAWLMSVGDRDV